ncbi:DUF4157 domain-containing protein [Chloroflexota bacterium]
MTQQPIGSAGREANAWAKHVAPVLGPQVRQGELLDMVERERMEASFGRDFKNVRVHYGYHAEEASRQLGARAFTFKDHIFGPRRSLDSATAEGQNLLAHELTHVVQQTQPRQRPQSRGPDISPGDRSQIGMVYLAPSQAGREQREAQAQATEQTVDRTSDSREEPGSTVNRQEVADRVYRLMQHDLILERERSTRMGG